MDVSDVSFNFPYKSVKKSVEGFLCLKIMGPVQLVSSPKSQIISNSNH